MYVNGLRLCHHLTVLGKCHPMERVTLNQEEQRRLLAGYRKEGARALAHGNRARDPHNALDAGVKRRIAELAATTYAGCNTQHFTELIAEKERMAVRRSTVRPFCVQQGCRVPGRGGHPDIAVAGSATRRKGSCCRSTAAATTGWKAEAPGSPWSAPSMMPRVRCLMRYSGNRKIPRVTSCCWKALSPERGYPWPCTTIGTAYSSIPKMDRNHSRNSWQVRKGRRN